jgi:hypothetical protein
VVRRHLWLFVLVASGATIVPGLLAFVALRWGGVQTGLAGVGALLVMMGAMVGVGGWIFSGGARRGR